MGKLAHYYTGLRGSILWKRVDRAVLDLIADGDIRLKTRRQWVVGYICHALTHSVRKSKSRSR
ncbi:MAG: hypothetical protein WA020_01615 [Candidatus Acidiferrales bacterium]